MALTQVTPEMLAQKMTLGTAVATTSGTSKDSPDIPTWAKRVTLLFTGVSTSGTSLLLVRLGAGGSIESTSYSAVGGLLIDNTATNAAADSTGFTIRSSAANAVLGGSIIFTNVTGNTWAAQGCIGDYTNGRVIYVTGSKALSGALDRVRITTVNGTDTFDAGSINILYEG